MLARSSRSRASTRLAGRSSSRWVSASGLVAGGVRCARDPVRAPRRPSRRVREGDAHDLARGRRHRFGAGSCRSTTFASIPSRLDERRVPIIVGGNSDAALRRVADARRRVVRIQTSTGPIQVRDRLTRLRDLCAEHPTRDPAELEIAVALIDGRPADVSEARGPRRRRVRSRRASPAGVPPGSAQWLLELFQRAKHLRAHAHVLDTVACANVAAASSTPGSAPVAASLIVSIGLLGQGLPTGWASDVGDTRGRGCGARDPSGRGASGTVGPHRRLGGDAVDASRSGPGRSIALRWPTRSAWQVAGRDGHRPAALARTAGWLDPGAVRTGGGGARPARCVGGGLPDRPADPEPPELPGVVPARPAGLGPAPRLPPPTRPREVALP